MARGRKRTPIPLRVLRGNPSGKPLPQSPGFAPGLPDEPGWLDSDAKDEWQRLTGILGPAHVLTKGDAGILHACCDAFSVIRRCQRALAGGLTYVTAAGLIKVRPEGRLLADARRQYVAYLAELGLSPASRTKVQPLASPKPTGIEKFLGLPEPNRG